MKTRLITILLITVTVFISQAQNVGINSDGTTPNSSAMLDVKSVNSGLLIPRVDIVNLSTAAPVTTPATSLLVYNTNTTTGPAYFYWNGTVWIELLGSDRAWQLDGNAITSGDFLGTTNAVDLVFKTTNTERTVIKADGKVGIGTASPTARLQVTGDNNTFLNVGTDNTYQGTISLFGNPSGFPGGEIDFYTGNDYDTDVPFYFIDAYQDWLRIGRHTYTYDFGLYKNGHIRMGMPRATGTLVPLTDPVKKLQVNDVYNGGIGLDYQNCIWFKNKANDNWIRALTVHGINTSDNDIYIGAGAGVNLPETNIHFDVAGLHGSNSIYIHGADGNVGIGSITDPTEALEIFGSIKIRDTTGVLKLGACDLIHEGGQIEYSGAAAHSNWITDLWREEFRIFSNKATTTTVNIFNANNTVSGVANLVVEGQVKAKNFAAVYSASGAYTYNTSSPLHLPDYVFDKYYNGFSKENPIYNIMNLSDVEAFIKENHHLPRVPSRAEITKDKSVNIQALQMVTLEKVEELYLFTIEQQTEIEELKNKNIELNKRINKLEELIIELSKQIKK